MSHGPWLGLLYLSTYLYYILLSQQVYQYKINTTILECKSLNGIGNFLYWFDLQKIVKHQGLYPQYLDCETRILDLHIPSSMISFAINSQDIIHNFSRFMTFYRVRSSVIWSKSVLFQWMPPTRVHWWYICYEPPKLAPKSTSKSSAASRHIYAVPTTMAHFFVTTTLCMYTISFVLAPMTSLPDKKCIKSGSKWYLRYLADLWVLISSQI